MMPSAVQAPQKPHDRRDSTPSRIEATPRDGVKPIEWNIFRNVSAGWCVLIASIATAIVFTATWTPDWLANDTAQTLSVARSIAASGNIATDVIFYEEHLQFLQSPVPQTVFPLGYPAVIALLMQLGLSDVQAAQVIVTLSFALVPLLLFWILQRFGVIAIWSAAISLIWLAMQSMWWNAQGLQSELPFIACTLGALACLHRAEMSVASWRWVIVAGTLAALAVSFRYAGVFFALSVGVVLAGDWLCRRSRFSFVRCAAFAALPLLTLTAMFARNASLVGDLKGGNNHLTDKPLSDVVRTMWYSISDLFGWSRAGAEAGEVSELLLLAGIVTAFGVVKVRARKLRHKVRSDIGAVSASRCSEFIPVMYCCIYVASLFWLERATSVGLCPRLLLPTVPFALIAFGQFVAWSSAQRVATWLRFAPACLLLLAMLCGQMELWAKHSQPSAVRDVQSAIDSLAAGNEFSQAIDIVALADGQPVLCNECHCVSNATQLPVVGLAAGNYTSREWNHDTVHELVDQFDVRLVLVFTEIFDEANESPAYFEALAAGDVPEWLTPLVTQGPVRVYAVNHSMD